MTVDLRCLGCAWFNQGCEGCDLESGVSVDELECFEESFDK